MLPRLVNLQPCQCLVCFPRHDIALPEENVVDVLHGQRSVHNHWVATFIDTDLWRFHRVLFSYQDKTDQRSALGFDSFRGVSGDTTYEWGDRGFDSTSAGSEKKHGHR